MTKKATPTKTTPNKNRGQFLSRASLEIARLASVDEDRPGMNVLRLTETETIATDGHALARVTHPTFTPSGKESAGVSVSAAALPACSIPRDAALEVGRLIQKATKQLEKQDDGSETVPLAPFAVIDVDGVRRGDSFRIVVRTDEATYPAEIASVQLDFPNVDAVMPKKKPAVVMAFNGALLERVLSTARRMGVGANGTKGFVGLRFHVPTNPTDALRIEGDIADTGQHVEFVVMPARVPAGAGA